MRTKSMVAFAVVFFLSFCFRYSYAGEWDRMPNKSSPRLGKIMASGLNHTIFITSSGNDLSGNWSGQVVTVGKNDFSQLGRSTTALAVRCSSSGTFNGSRSLWYAKKWGIEPIGLGPLDPPNNGNGDPQLEVCSDQ